MSGLEVSCSVSEHRHPHCSVTTAHQLINQSFICRSSARAPSSCLLTSSPQAPSPSPTWACLGWRALTPSCRPVSRGWRSALPACSWMLLARLHACWPALVHACMLAGFVHALQSVCSLQGNLLLDVMPLVHELPRLLSTLAHSAPAVPADLLDPPLLPPQAPLPSWLSAAASRL